MTPLDIALRFAECGFHVFPMYRARNGMLQKPYGWAKNELTEPDHQDKIIPASNDLQFIQSWPELVQEKYGREVEGFGIIGEDCVILDLDTKNGKDGLTQFKALQANHKLPNPSMFTTTKSGGLHLFYRRPESLKTTHVKSIASVQAGSIKYNGIDLRGDGGFVVGPSELATGPVTERIGTYITYKIKPIHELPEFPAELLRTWCRTSMNNDLDNMISGSGSEEDEYKAKVRRGIIPEFIPAGARNETFYIFVNVLKSKGVPKDVARQMCKQMALVVEDPETFDESVNIEELLNRVYVIQQDNPYDIAVDLLSHGLFQLTNYKSKLHYVILEENPYLSSRTPHDESTMKTLLSKYQRTLQLANGKTKSMNPMDAIPKILTDENRADTIGFKPRAGQVFTLHDDPGARRFLNLYKPVPIPATRSGLDPTIWDEFTLLVSRIFGDKDTPEYQLGIDFIAWLIQYPHIKPSIAPFVMSHQRGVGKSLLFNTIIHILGTSKDGERQGRLTKLDEITGRFFNPTGCVVNLIDEVQFPVHRDTRRESVTFWRHLKNLITAETISVEIKGGATYQVPNSAALFLAGNTGSHFPIEEFDRRLWIIDANPPLLERGLVDRLFMIIKGQGLGPDDRVRLLSSIRYELMYHKIENDLSAIRAPMTDVKREMFLNSLTDTEEWFVSHFENTDNLFAATPVITKSALMYIFATSDKIRSSRYVEDPEALFRDLKRRGYIRPIRTMSNSNQSRNMPIPHVAHDGQLYQMDKRDTVYTTRDHGSFDNLSNTEVMQAFIQNAHTIKRFKGQVQKGIPKDIINDIEDYSVQSD